jgi:hypothetical protein
MMVPGGLGPGTIVSGYGVIVVMNVPQFARGSRSAAGIISLPMTMCPLPSELAAE